jgi:hypothetical protein
MRVGSETIERFCHLFESQRVNPSPAVWYETRDEQEVKREKEGDVRRAVRLHGYRNCEDFFRGLPGLCESGARQSNASAISSYSLRDIQRVAGKQ